MSPPSGQENNLGSALTRSFDALRKHGVAFSRNLHGAIAACLLLFLFFVAGGTAFHESATVDEVAHVGAGLSYLQRLDLRLNPEHPPLAKVLAAIPLAVRGTRADYSSDAWNLAGDFFPAYAMQWVFGDAVLGRWNAWKPTLLWARLPMLVLTLLLGWFVYLYATRLGGRWAGLLCLSAYVTTPAILTFGPLVITDLPVTLFSVIALWQFGEIWTAPTHKNARLFGMALGTALLSKFTGLLLLPVIVAVFIQTRFWPAPAEPVDKTERKLWRKTRWRCVLRGIVWSAIVVYVAYFVLSWNQPNDALDRIGSGSWAFLIRRPLMPIWLYYRGLLLMLLTASRPTFLFGQVLPHGVPYYFPIAFALKSTLGFLLLLLLNAAVALAFRKHKETAITPAYRAHWRVLMAGFFVFLVVCLLSRLDISIRHFTVPIVLLILMLAPLPRMMRALPRHRLLEAVTVVLVVACFAPILAAYPYFFPFANSLSFGRPLYYLLNDSNVTWNEGLPALERFAKQQHLTQVELDWASLSDPVLIVPEAQIWNCQTLTDADAGRWVAVEAVSILDNHNCGYLQQYPHQALAGGAIYVFKIPSPVPSIGKSNGPPVPTGQRIMWGMPFDLRAWAINVERHPERLPSELKILMQKFQQPPKQNAK
ncbi:MAG: glycosyltransferase family 39 protein [Acidobacteriaceae bacterium]|nr:glycosyltransferase family 39 protein [Acidobacteriaceae bacterium]